MVKFIAEDGESIEVMLALCRTSQLVHRMDQSSASGEEDVLDISVKGPPGGRPISSWALERAVDYMKYGIRSEVPFPLEGPLENNVTEWEMLFLQSLFQAGGRVAVVDVLSVAKFLQIRSLCSLIYAWFASKLVQLLQLSTGALDGAEKVRYFWGLTTRWSSDQQLLLEAENAWPEDEW